MHTSIYTIMASKPHNKHYLLKYLNFIVLCSKSQANSTTEDHHIIPKSKQLFPEYKSFKLYPWNKVKLMSYLNNGNPIYLDNPPKQSSRLAYVGWYAVKEIASY